MLRSKVSLRIIGNIDVEEISNELGITPSYAHRKGDKDRFGDQHKSDIWVLNSPLNRSESIEKHFEWIVEQFNSKHEILKKIKSYAKIDIFCGITSAGQNGFSLTYKTLSIICDLQIKLEISLITFSEDK